MNDARADSAGFDESLYERFESAWRRHAPQPIEACLPAEDDPRYLPTLEELIRVDLDYHWRLVSNECDAKTLAAASIAGYRPKVEDYAARFPVIRQPELLLSLLYEEFLVRAAWDRTPAIVEYRERFPDLDIPAWTANELSGETGIGEIDGESRAARGNGITNRLLDGELPVDLGKYVLLEEIGRGGMGVVYRAHQKQADRFVALKVIRRDLVRSRANESHSSALERFRHEVQATARLEHENIISVYDVGDFDRDPYFSMQYVDGMSLGEILEEGPLENRRAANYLMQVARAVALAHREGIYHRDLKPQNILVERATDRPLVADFGLAKLQESGDDLTHSGDIMGSPPYMSPEQATDASRISGQSDVYSLGATLYHLLTGHAPFEATSLTEMIQKIINEDPIPPRRYAASIDRDLQTICLKCLEKSLSRRYASADILASELNLYLDNKPILARPVGLVGRVWRWCLRNPIAAVNLSLAIVGLLIALVATTVGYLRTSASLLVATEAKKESDKSFHLARSAVDRLLTHVGDDDLLNRPGMQPLRRKLLEEAAGFYEQFLEQRKDDPTVRDELAEAHYRVGCIREDLGDHPAALESLMQARKMQRQLHEESLSDLVRLAALGDTTNRIGRVRTEQRDLGGALAAYRESRDCRRKLTDMAPSIAAYRLALANTHMNEGLTEMEMGVAQWNVLLNEWSTDIAQDCKLLYDAARKSMEQAQAIRGELVQADPAAFAARHDRAKGFFNLANLELRAGELAECRNNASLADHCFEKVNACLETAIGEFDSLVREDDESLENRFQLALCYSSLAVFRAGMGNGEQSLELYSKAEHRLQALVDTNPDVNKYRGELAGVHINRSRLGRPHDAVRELVAAQDLLRPLVEAPRYRVSLITTLRELYGHLRTLVESEPDNVDWQEQLVATKERLTALGMTTGENRSHDSSSAQPIP